MDLFDRLFVITAFSLQGALLAYFIWRKIDFGAALRWGWLVYALALPAVVISLILLLAGKSWFLWIGGFLFLAWALFGFNIDILRATPWRNPINPPLFFPYVTLYLAAQMFYWWPLGTLNRSSWYIYAFLFVLSTFFNWTSHAS